ncbi:hypothetical protein INR49_030989 [Caranx melampygus]|nr:hypothetical protein INR49_030989 [Caranx melampygus]
MAEMETLVVLSGLVIYFTRASLLSCSLRELLTTLCLAFCCSILWCFLNIVFLCYDNSVS